jgi:hypothetical protein
VYRVQLSTDGFSTVSIGSDTANLSVLFGTGGEGAPLPVNTLYAARVQSVNNGNASAFLPVGSTSTYAVTPSGTAVAAISSQTVTLDWSPAGNPEPGTSYQVQSDASPAFPSPRTITVSTSGATVASLAMGGTYYFRVRAISAAGAPTGYDAAVSTATLPAAPARAASPAAFTLGLSSISWSWAGSPDAVSYEVYGDTLSTLLLSTQTGTTFVQTGLGPNASSYLMIVAVNANGEGPRSVPGLGWTLANPPTGTSFPGVFATSATVSWSLNGNPPYTAVEVQRSPTGAIYSTIATGVSGSSYTDTGLLGCTPYYYRVRNLNGNGAPTAWDAAISFTTGVSTPLAPSGLSASPLTGNRISFSWSPSPTTDIAAYKLYSDGGTGTVNFASSFAYFTSTETAFVSPPQASSASYAFVLRAINRCGTEEANTTTRASSPAEAAPAAVSAVVSSPPGGLRVDGNRLTVAASPASGALTDFSSVRFQYRASGVSDWTDIPAAAAAHPNPATAAPYYTQWDVTVLAAGPYEVRAIAYDLSSSSDPAPAATTIIVDPATPDLSETDIGGGRSRRDQKVYSSIDNSVFVGGLSAGDPLARLVLPAGALGDESATLSLISDPDLTGVSTTVAGAFAAGLFARVTLSNGQSSLNGRTALLTLSYPDANNDGVVDGTGGLVASNLRFYSYDSVSGLWRQDLSTSFDPAARTITGGTPHFTLFGVFTAVAAVTNLDAVRAYPVPFKPNGKNPDEGRPYAAGIPGTGIFFDNLPTNATVRIYTVDGRLVADLAAAGGTSIQWNAKNGAGRDVATGGYFAVISVPGLRSTVRKLSIIR